MLDLEDLDEDCGDETQNDHDYRCIECGIKAPCLNSDEILSWGSGYQALSGERDPLMLNLLCPACWEKAKREEAEQEDES